MQIADLGDVQLHYALEGPDDGPVIVFAHALGTDMHVWDDLLPLLPKGLRVLRYDLRGHGRSSCPPAPYSMGALVRDTEQLLDHLNLRECLFVGLSIGGMIAQGLAVKRLDLVRALVLSNTSAKLGMPHMWQDRVNIIRHEGMAGLVDVTMERWFSRSFRRSDALPYWRDRFLAQSIEGYAGCCAAIAGTDFYTPTSGLRLPTLGIVGSEDGSTPADLVRETVDLIPGSQFALIRRAGHLPCVEQPQAYADLLAEFLNNTGHLVRV